MNFKPKIIAVAGGSGSGKTTFSSKLHEIVGMSHCAVISQDSYYIDQSHKFDQDGGNVNFDHPNSIDFDLLCNHIEELKLQNSIAMPIYDFATHKRLEQTNLLIPHPIIILDGILIFTHEKLVELLDYKIFIDCPENLRFERRLRRDVEERGRTPDGVKAQLEKQVKPMHDEFVDPSKTHADDIVTQDLFENKVNFWAGKLKEHI